MGADWAAFARRLSALDASLFACDEAARGAVARRLGWLGSPEETLSRVEELEAFAREVAADGIRRVVLLGMGGSSLCPLVVSTLFEPHRGFPSLTVVDTTSPETAARLLDRLDPGTTLFVTSSKSGTTVEPNDLLAIFREWSRRRGVPPSRNMVAVTDPGTPLENLAREAGFRRLFGAPPDVGGRFSALTVFGMLPAALLGVDIKRLLERAADMALRCRGEDPAVNPGVALGRWLAERAAEGRDKLTLLASPRLEALGLWLEQLLAESTGKQGRGVLPVAGEPAGGQTTYGTDRCFVRLSLSGAPAPQAPAGFPTLDLDMASSLDLGAEFYRWEVATAALGHALGVNPFDEPNVTESKANTRDILEGKPGLAPEPPVRLLPGMRLHLPAGMDDAPAEAGEVFRRFLAMAPAWGYLAVLVYLPEGEEVEGPVGRLRLKVLETTRLATTFGYGPRYLHSTGQYHKGGPQRGIFLFLTGPGEPRVPIPGRGYTLGELQGAQALGDEHALRGRGRPVLRVELDGGAAGVEEAVRLLAGA